MKIRGIIFLVAILLISSALAYALSPSITINASPGASVDTTVIISSYSYDPDQSGLQNLSIYEDGILNNSINCLSQQSCSIANTFVHGKSNHTYYAVAVDSTNNVVTSNTVAVTFVGLNTPPDFTSPLPNITLAEDSGFSLNLTDLWNFADDAHTADSNLAFAITSQSNTTLAACSINVNRFVQCNTTGQNLSGTSIVNYSVTDQAIGLSPTFTNFSTQLITITPVNDPPMLNVSLPFIEVIEDSSNTSINLSNHFYDIDSPLTFTFINTNPNISISLFNSTRLNVTSTNNFTGNSSLTIIASDGSLSINITRNITVLPVNDPPFFNPLLINKTGSTDNLFTYNITASDVDSTNLTFFDNTALFNISSLGFINFTPIAMANETILITVCDDSNAPNNCTSSSFRLTISDITPPLFGNITEPLDPSIFNQSVPYQFSISLSDPAGIGNVSFTIGSSVTTNISNLSGVFTATISILGAGIYNYRWTFSDTQGNANNTPLFNFTVIPANSTITLFLNGSNSNLITTLGSIVNTSVSLLGPTNEFVNYFVNNTLITSALQNNTVLLSNSSTCSLEACNVTARFAGNQNFTSSSSTLNVTFLDAASPIFTTILASPSSPAAYSTSTNYLFSVNALDDVAVSSVRFSLNGVNSTPNQSGSLHSISFANLSAGNYTIIWFANDTSGNFNTTSFIYTISAGIPVISLTSSPVPPYSFGQNSAISCSVNTPEVTLTFTRNSATLTNLTDNTANLAAGNYTYNCSTAQTQNFTAASQSNSIVVNQATPQLSLTLNNLSSDIFVTNGTLVNATGTIINPTGNFIELYINGSLIANNTNTVFDSTNYTDAGNNNITIKFAGNENFTSSSLTRFVIVGSPVAKFNFIPASGSLLNNSFVFISFDTSPAAVCRYAFTDLPFSSMTSTFTTTGAINHSGTVPGLTLGLNNVHVACSNDTATTNADLVYNVTNILDNSTMTNTSTTNSIITFSTANAVTAINIIANQSNLNDSILTRTNISQSTVTNSILTNCVVRNSTVKGYSASNCNITNSVVDPNTISNLTGSNISADSTVMNSNVTYSNVVNSTITNSNVDRSSITDSRINRSNVTNSNVTNSQISNTTVTSATINNNIISSGTIVMSNGQTYNATQNGPMPLANITNVPPVSSFTINPNPTIIGSSTIFISTSTDANVGGPLNDSIVSYFWNFGDGTNTTGSSANHTYASTGTFTVSLTVTDSYSESSSSTQQASINQPSSGGGGSGGGGGGGGGGGAGGGNRVRIKLTGLPTTTIVGTKYQVLFEFNGILYTARFDPVSSQGAALTIIPPDPAKIYAAPINTPIRINLDGDEDYDLRLLVTEYQYGRVKAVFTLINELVNPPLPIFPEIIEEPVAKQPEPQPVEQPPVPLITGASILDQIPINKKDALTGSGVIVGLGLILFIGRALQMFGLRRLLFRLKVFGFRRAFRL